MAAVPRTKKLGWQVAAEIAEGGKKYIYDENTQLKENFNYSYI